MEKPFDQMSKPELYRAYGERIEQRSNLLGEMRQLSQRITAIEQEEHAALMSEHTQTIRMPQVKF